MEYESYSEKDTFHMGYTLGKEAVKGSIYCLTGDLGTGKTVFTKGFAKGIGIEEHVSSPTFTIVQEYKEGRVPLYHFDVYRISDISEMDEIGYEDYFYGDGVCFIEWAELISELLPENVVNISLTKELEKGINYRKIIIENNNRKEGNSYENISN